MSILQVGNHLGLIWENEDEQSAESRQQMPIMPTGHLFEFCSRDYWQSLDFTQLIKWIMAIRRDINAPQRAQWGLGRILENSEVNLTGSGHVFEDFEGKIFNETDLYEFLSWAGQSLVCMAKQRKCVLSKRKVI